jgi:hypothetical protein
MFRLLLFAFGAAVVVCVVLYFATGQARYVLWARRILLAGLVAGLAFFALLIIKRLVAGLI